MNLLHPPAAAAPEDDRSRSPPAADPEPDPDADDAYALLPRLGIPRFRAEDTPSTHDLGKARREAVVRAAPDPWRVLWLERWHMDQDHNSLLSVPKQKTVPFTSYQSDLLNPRYIARVLIRKRATKSLAEVMPLVEQLMLSGFKPNTYTLGVLIGKDIWRTITMTELAEQLGVEPNRVNWSQLMNNALRTRGPLTALDIYDAAPAVETSAVQNVARALVNRTPFYRPDAHALRRVSRMFRRQVDQKDEEDDSRLEMHNFLGALRGTHALEKGERDEDVTFFLDWIKRVGGGFHGVPALSEAIERVYRAGSFEEAVEGVWRVPGVGDAPYNELLSLLARICALRFPERSTIPPGVLKTYVHRVRDAGDDVKDNQPLVLALESYAAAGVQLHIEEEAAGVDAKSHLAYALSDTRELEEQLLSSDVRLVTALARAYSSLGSFSDSLRLWNSFTQTGGQPNAQLAQVMLSSCRRHWALPSARSIFSLALASGCADARVTATFAETLADLGALSEAVEFFETHCSTHPEAARSAIRILRWVATELNLKGRMFKSRSEMWSDPKVMEDYDLNFDQRRRRDVGKLLRRLTVGGLDRD
ncbi:hypothetical protein EXIGLDRAFT_828373 [Exidia glandulosa HHB12029]|uniref:Pentacotripeptide-repeat region of PRORP domain-containing protein n=1 Tax=Exidia glandulosa HHB12029 TaxID=1314781 RepID=A0A165QDF4_EXIGL|nr:hypothetical protein EXIGLDRAFT_828373 [Exidia glandulosa HHB12029]